MIMKITRFKVKLIREATVQMLQNIIGRYRGWDVGFAWRL